MTDHCALTARVAETAGLAIHGFVLSQTAAVADPSAESNAETVRARAGLRWLGVLPHLGRPEDAVGC